MDRICPMSKQGAPGTPPSAQEEGPPPASSPRFAQPGPWTLVEGSRHSPLSPSPNLALGVGIRDLKPPKSQLEFTDS